MGFALETEKEIDSARAKLREKNLDLIAVNNPVAPDSGFGKDEVRAAVLDSSSSERDLRLMSKADLARECCAALDAELVEAA